MKIRILFIICIFSLLWMIPFNVILYLSERQAIYAVTLIITIISGFFAIVFLLLESRTRRKK